MLGFLRITLFVAILLLTVSKTFADVADKEEAIAFTNFIKQLVSSSHTTKTGKFCLLGSDEISQAILSQDRQAINLTTNPQDYGECIAVYISRSQQKGLRAEIEKFNKNKIITIATFDGFTESGGMIQVQMGRRDFELVVNPKELKESGVRLSALISNLIIN